VKRNERLVMAVASNLLEVAAIVLIAVYLLPVWDIRIPIYGIVLLAAAWVAVSVAVYRKGSRALTRRVTPGLTDMTGSKGVVIRELALEGKVRIGGEIWHARSRQPLETGRRVTVVAQQGMLLEVEPL
jgi:membrane-bound serine protease (ClpP class)